MHFELKGRLGVIYNGMWENRDVAEKIGVKKEKSTYKISGEVNKEEEAIAEKFKIENMELFCSKFHQAVGGQGNERNKILTMHSSSRCSLLCFYGLCKENMLKLKLDDREVYFDYSQFEFKNPVIGYPSNMDVVLVSKDRDVVLFLESKFSEYYIGAATKSSFISEQYINNEFSQHFYDEVILQENFGLKRIPDEKTVYKRDEEGNIIGESKRKGFVLQLLELNDEGGEAGVYLDGFKQMISHYIGIRRRIRGEKRDSISVDKKEDSKLVLDIIKRPDTKVYLGEVIFDKFTVPKGYEDELHPNIALKRYGQLYEKLAEEMNLVLENDSLSNRFKILPHELRYSEIMQKVPKLEERTKKFYGIN